MRQLLIRPPASMCTGADHFLSPTNPDPTRWATHLLLSTPPPRQGCQSTYGSDTPTVCSVSGSTATLLAAGTCTVVASQAGNGAYSPAPNVSRSFTVQKRAQTITFGQLPNRTVGDAPVALNATASSGLAVSFSSDTPAVCNTSGSTATLLAAGTCTIVAGQAGSGAYSPAPNESRSFTVQKRAQTINFSQPPERTLGDAPVALNATASSGLSR